MKNRRVGTFTMGLALVMTGILTIISLFTDIIDVVTVLKLSPIILVLLGIEMIIYSIRGSEDNLKYDGLAIFVSLVLIVGTLFSTIAVTVVDHFHLLN